MMRAVRIVCFILALFDLLLALALLAGGESLFASLGIAQFAVPRFFMICVALFLLQYVYVQLMPFRDPVANSTCVLLTILIRASFPVAYIHAAIAWGEPWTLMHTLVAASAAGDLAVAAFLVVALRRLGIPLLQGDRPAQAAAPSPWLSRLLYTLALAEFIIGWNWALAPRFWMNLLAVHSTVDPFWTRATGVFLVNIAVIQFLGARDLNRYRTAVITSGIFRALWPIFYWTWCATHGEGNKLLYAFILFFSFFDAASCAAIFILLRRAVAACASRTASTASP
jgi:hypothetical protein